MSRPIFRPAPAGVHFRIMLLVAILGALLILPAPAAAHTNGVMQLAAVPAGPYNLTVWTTPDPATTSEELHVAIAVVTAEDAAPVLEADIEVRLTPEDGGSVVSGPATIENSDNKFLHEAILDVESDGNYKVEIFVEGADGGVGQASFPLLVEGGGGLDWTLVIAAVAVVVLVVILVVRRYRKPESPPEPSASSVDESPAGT